MAHFRSLSTKSGAGGFIKEQSFTWNLPGPSLFWTIQRTGITVPTMKIEGLRSPRQKVAGLFHLGRMLDKIRLFQAGRLPPDYHPNLGLSVGLDGHLCGFLGVAFEAVSARVNQGGTDDEIAEWCFCRGLRPSKIQTRVWNEFARKFGWNDAAARFIARTKAEGGLADRADLVTAFELIDFRENSTDSELDSA
jgi:hypothetical protein